MWYLMGVEYLTTPTFIYQKKKKSLELLKVMYNLFGMATYFDVNRLM